MLVAGEERGRITELKRVNTETPSGTRRRLSSLSTTLCTLCENTYCLPTHQYRLIHVLGYPVSFRPGVPVTPGVVRVNGQTSFANAKSHRTRI